MKYFKLIATVFVVGSLALFASCGGDGPGGGDDPEPKLADEIIQSGSWSLTTVNRDGNDVSSDFSGFTISFNSGSYTTSNGDAFGVWASSGTYSVGSNSETYLEIIIEDGRTVFVNILSETSITAEIDVYNTTLGIGGRSKGIAGHYTFSLSK